MDSLDLALQNRFMPSSTIDIATPTGGCSTQIFVPEGNGPWPAVILCFDAGGPRPAMSEIAARIAHSGYLVAIPDLYHRIGPIAALFPEGTTTRDWIKALVSDRNLFDRFRSTYYATATNSEHLRADVEPLLDHLAQRADVRGGVGTTGYCMGGNISFRLATIFGERIAATASFHGGGLATPADDSPHRQAARIRSRVYIAGAIEDPSFTDDMKRELVAALLDADVDATVETYSARHGFVVSDFPTFDAPCAERHHAALDGLFAATLRPV